MSGSKFRVNSSIKLIIVFVAVTLLASGAYLVFFNKGSLEINSNPQDTTVYINGTLASSTTKLAHGQYTVKIAKEGYTAFFKNITISGGVTKKISPYLKKLPEPVLVAENSNFIVRYGNNIYYLSGNALFKKVGDETQQITPTALDNVKKIVLTPDEQNALVLKNDGRLFFYEFRLYNFVSQIQTQIADNIKDVAISHDGKDIAYAKFPSTGEQLIILSKPNGSNPSVLFNLKEIDSKNPQLSFNADDTRIFIADTNFYLLNIVTAECHQITSGVSSILPSPSSPMILATDNDNNPKIIDYDGKVLYNLKSNTLIEKTSWIKDSNDLVFAVDNILYKVSLTDLKMTPYQTAKLGNIEKILSSGGGKVLYIADNKLNEVEMITGWE